MENAKAYKIRFEKNLAIKDKKEKILALEDMIKQYPKPKPAYLALLKIYKASNKNKQVLIHLEKTTAQFPKNDNLKIEYGKALIASNNLEKATAIFEEILKRKPKNFNAVFYFGELLLKCKNFSESIKYFERAKKIDSNSFYPDLKIATVFRRQNLYKKAKELLLETDKKFPNEFPIVFQIAVTAKNKGKYIEAINYFQKSKKLAKNYKQKLNADIAIVESLCDLNKSNEAFKQIELLEKTYLDNATLLFLKAQILLIHKKIVKAIAVYHKILEIAPNNIQANFELAKCQKQIGNIDNAISLAKKALEKSPNNLSGKIFLGNCFLELKDFNAATAIAESMLKVNSKHIGSKILLAKIYIAKGKISEAIILLENYTKSNISNFAILSRLAQIYQSLSDFEKAEYHFYNAYQQFPENENAIRNYSNLLFEKGQKENAINFLVEERIKFSKSILINKTLAIFYKKIGLFDQSENILASILKDDPNNFDICLQRSNLLTLKGDFNQSLKILNGLKTDKVTAKASIYRNMYNIYIASYDYTKAEILMRKAIEIDPNTSIHKITLASKYLFFGEFDNAYAELKKATEAALVKNSIGKITIPLKSHIAKILNEIRSNPVLMNLLASFSSLPNKDRITKIGNLVFQNPNYFGASLYFVKELRVQNIFHKINLALPEKSNSKNNIPKIIFQYWDNYKVPMEVMKICKSWQKNNPDYQYELFSYQSALKFLMKNYEDEVVVAFKNCNHPAMQSDFFRLAYLNKNGGYYIDADDLCLKSLNQISTKNSELIVYQETVFTIANNFIAAIPNQKIIKYAFEKAIEKLTVYSKDNAWFKTGPALLTSSLSFAIVPYLKIWNANQENYPPINVLDYATIRKTIYQFLPLSYKKTNKSWMTEATKGKINAI